MDLLPMLGIAPSILRRRKPRLHLIGVALPVAYTYVESVVTRLGPAVVLA